MRPEGVLLIVVPLALYGTLVLVPQNKGLLATKVTVVASALALLFAIVIHFEHPEFYFGPIILGLIAMIALSVSTAAYGYHAVARRRGASWVLRFAFLAVSGGIFWLLMAAFELLN